MTEHVTLMDAARQYSQGLAAGERQEVQPEVERFVRWCGADRPASDLRPTEVAKYAETLTGTVTDASRRAESVKGFLAFAKKAGYTGTNLGVHLRLRKGQAAPVSRGPAPKEVQVSEEARAALVAELESLKAQRPRIVADIRRAMSDKDFRENAPLDAAKQQQAYIEGRIRTLEATLDNAVLVEGGPAATAGEVVDIGSTVHVRNLKSDSSTVYTLVRPGEVNPAQGRISYESPVGQALRQHRAGDEVEVATPSGTVRLRIERVEA